MKRIPLFNLPLLHEPILSDIEERIQKVVASGQFVGGEEIASFEYHFAKIARLPFVAAVSSGTDALIAALTASNVSYGDYVVTTPLTFIATVEAIVAVGAIPLFVDVDKNGVMDSDKLGMLLKKTDKKIAAVVPVHLHGVMADMRKIAAWCIARDIPVIEDAAQAHGAMREGVAPGELSLFATYSFYPGKNLGAFGDAGAVVSTSENAVKEIQAIRNHGRYGKKYEHLRMGFNMRMDALQAAVLLAKIPFFPEWQHKRQVIAERYCAAFKELGIINHIPCDDRSFKNAWHLFTICVPKRDRIRTQLAKRGIETGIHYPIPIHLQEACSSCAYKRGDFPRAEQFADETLSIPFWPGMTDEDIDYVVEIVSEIVG